jgi:hypothetical protein
MQRYYIFFNYQHLIHLNRGNAFKFCLGRYVLIYSLTYFATPAKTLSP